MIKMLLKNGYIAYQVKSEEFNKIFKSQKSKCDQCKDQINIGYLVPIINEYLCGHCFLEWLKEYPYYPEDLWYEKIYEDSYEKYIPVNQTLVDKEYYLVRAEAM